MPLDTEGTRTNRNIYCVCVSAIECEQMNRNHTIHIFLHTKKGKLAKTNSNNF